MAGQFCTSCNLETVLSPSSTGPFSAVSGSPTINIGAGIAGNNTVTLPPGAQLTGVPPGGPTAAFSGGFGLAMSVGPAAAQLLFSVVVGTNVVTLMVDNTGTLTLTAGSSFTVVSPSGTFLFNGQRQYIECYLSGIGSGQTGKIQYEGTVVQTGTGTTYSGSNFPSFIWGCGPSATAANGTFDSFYYLDLTGSGRNNMLGKRVVTQVTSNGVGQFAQFTPNGAANNWQCMSSIPPGGDTLYSSDSTPGDQVANTLTSAYGLSSVDFVMQRTNARQEVASGGRTIALGIGNGSSIVYGSAQNLGVAYAGINQVWDVDPTTSSAWVLGNLGSRQVAVKTAS